MYIIIGILIVLITLLGRYFYKNMHPKDEKFLKEAKRAGFEEKTKPINNGAIINYGEGPNNGEPLLLIHGQGVSWEDYSAVLPELSKKFHVYAVDCFGHGGSSQDESLYSCKANCEALSWFIDNVIGEKCFVSGHSSGGVMTAWLAAYASENVKGIVLEDPPIFRVTPEQMQEGKGCFAWKDSFETINDYLNQDFKKDYVQYYYTNGYMTSLFGGLKYKMANAVVSFRKKHPGEPLKIIRLPNSLVRMMNYVDEYDLLFGESFYNGSWMSGIEQEEMLKNIKCSTIYLKAATNYGKDGVLYAANSDEDAKKVQDCIADCETITIKSGHDIHFEHPEVFVSACEKLIDK